jgi:hypothetical protein
MLYFSSKGKVKVGSDTATEVRRDGTEEECKDQGKKHQTLGFA